MSDYAENQIMRLLAEYIQAHDREDPDAVAACFTEDGRLSVPSGARPEGRQAVRDFMVDQYARRGATKRLMKHLYANSNIRLEGETASVVSDWVAYESVNGGAWTINMIGQSIDRVVLRNGQWLLAERRNIDSRRDRSQTP